MISLPKSKFILAFIVALSQSAVLGYMIESRAHILRNGQEVVLQTEPVDPRDLLRGDYVILRYLISEISVADFEGEKPQILSNQPVYVALKKGAEGHWVHTRASWQPIANLEADETVLIGRTPASYSISGNNAVPINFGIERYYVPEGQGREIERGNAQKAVQVTVAVDKSGKAQIKSLSLNGKTLYQEPLY